MNEDDVAAGDFLTATHLVPDELAMVADELEVKVLHLAAGAAPAGRCLLDVSEPLAESEICRLNRILEKGAVELFGDGINEGGVAFEFGEAERRPERAHHRVHDIGYDVLGVVEFNARYEVGVTRYVGDQEKGGFCFRKHGKASQRGSKIAACGLKSPR
jgi:hypothetical protein